MDTYSALLQLIDELNEKIRVLEMNIDNKRKEINRLKRELKPGKEKCRLFHNKRGCK